MASLVVKGGTLVMGLGIVSNGDGMRDLDSIG